LVEKNWKKLPESFEGKTLKKAEKQHFSANLSQQPKRHSEDKHPSGEKSWWADEGSGKRNNFVDTSDSEELHKNNRERVG